MQPAFRATNFPYFRKKRPVTDRYRGLNALMQRLWRDDGEIFDDEILNDECVQMSDNSFNYLLRINGIIDFNLNFNSMEMEFSF